MLEYNEGSEKARRLAAHYASRVGGRLLLDFVTGRVDVHSQEEAKEVIAGFWQMTDLAIEDNENGSEVEGVSDIEFWMHKLFNKVYGYMTKNGYEEVWKRALRER